jgi:hypothetical protein
VSRPSAAAARIRSLAAFGMKTRFRPGITKATQNSHRRLICASQTGENEYNRHAFMELLFRKA